MQTSTRPHIQAQIIQERRRERIQQRRQNIITVIGWGFLAAVIYLVLVGLTV